MTKWPSAMPRRKRPRKKSDCRAGGAHGDGRPVVTAGSSPHPGDHDLSKDEFASWPAPLRSLCRSHGEAAVYDAGTASLGYPPTWAATAPEFRKVQQALESFKKEKAQWDGK